MKKGLVLEGGAMRGMFTAGVLDVMMENKIEYDGAVGVSAGAAFGCNYKSGQIGRALRYNKKFCGDPRYCGFASLIKTGNIFNTEFCYGEVPLIHDKFDFKSYEENPMDFYVVCTDIERGVPVYHNYKGWEDSGFDWIRASASMPVVSQIVNIDGHKFLDGGISTSVPLKFFEEKGYEKNVVVLTQPKDYKKQKNKMLFVIRRMYKEYPKFIKLMEDRHIMYNNETEYVRKREKEGKAFVIRPKSSLPVNRIEKDPKKLEKVYEIGRKTAEENLTDLKKYLNIN